MLYIMINVKDSESEKSLSKSQIINKMMTMLIEFNTALCTVLTAIYYLLKNPVCIIKVCKEIDSVIDNSNFIQDYLKKLPYCAKTI